MNRMIRPSAFYLRNYVSESRALLSSTTKRYCTLRPKCLAGISTRHPSQRADPQSHHRMVSAALCRANSSMAVPQKERPWKNHLDTIDKVLLDAEPIGQLEYPSFWLRDNCQCSECIHPDTRQRIVDTFSIPPDVTAHNISYGSDTVGIHWSDGHAGVYPYSWLSAHRFGTRPPKGGKQYLRFRDFESVKPGSESLPTVSYENVMEKEESVLEWLEQIYKWGFCLVKGVPVEPESTQALLERISFIRNTHYGGFWDFTSDLTFKDTAYTSEALGAHTDNTYFTDPARLQLFHLLSHTHGEGGATLLVDGFKAAQVILEESPDNCKVLIKCPQPFHSSGNEHVCIQPRRPTPVLARHRQTRMLYQIRWNNYDRAAKVDWASYRQQAWYTAARHWNEIIRRPEMELWLQLEPGTALIFDNWRMLHGRSAFAGKRRMCGGYINNDDFVSRYRLLKLGRQNALNQIGTVPDPIDV
ncbi:hypothetical protein VTN77DRAFT_184 [Rasamsonia byssochlamydoides]|uniref:uncharacterized protein n=1 Tax=Rasamsonia byssochlamydoides TaxID=89139 RepID=UPI0037436DF8